MASTLRELIVSVSADTRKYQSEMQRAQQTTGQLYRGVQQGAPGAVRAWDQQTAAARTHATAIEAGSQAISKYMGIAAGALGVGALVGMADQWTNISARVRLATTSSSEFEMVQERLARIADSTYRSYGEAADQFASTARIMRELGFETGATLDSAEALGLALVAGGSDAQKGATALDAWSKSMAQGRIATDQWQTLLLGTPRVAQALADGLGKTTVELTKMAREGTLVAGLVVPAMTSQMEALRGEVAQMPTEFRDAVVRVNNQLMRFVGGMNETYDVTGRLVSGLEFLTENIDTVARVAGGAAIGVLSSKMITMAKATIQAAQSALASRAAYVAEATAMRDSAMQSEQNAQAAVRRARAAMTAARGTQESGRQARNLAAALQAETQATLRATAAQEHYTRAKNTAAAAGRGLLGLLGGPTGLALTVGAVAAGWLLLRDNSDEATNALIEMKGPLDEVLAKYKELGSAQQRQAMRAAREEIDEAAEAMQQAVKKMSQNVGGTGVGAVFREIDEQVRAGTLSAEEGSKRISAALDTYLGQRGRGEGMKNLLIDLAANWESNAQKAQQARERVAGFNQANTGTEPGAAAAASGLRDQASGYRELGEEAQKALQKMQDQAQNVRGQIERLGKSAREVAILDVRDEFRRLAASGEVDFSKQDDPNVRRYIEAGAELIRNRETLASGQQRLAEAARATAAARREANKEESEAEKLATQLLERYQGIDEAQKREIALYGDSSRAAAVAYDIKSGALAGYKGELLDVIQEQARWLDWLDDMAALDGVWDGISEGYKKTADTMSTYADQAARNMQSHFADYLFDPFAEGTRGMVDGFSQAIRRMLAEAAASRLFEMVGGAMAGYGGQGTWGNIVRGIGGVLQTEPGKAGGGHVRPRSLQPVAEHGPELLQVGGQTMLMMGASGGIVSPLMNKAGGGAGASTGSVRVEVINNGAPVQAQASAQKQPDGSQLIRLVLSAVRDDISSGGGTLSAIKGRLDVRDRI